LAEAGLARRIVATTLVTYNRLGRDRTYYPDHLPLGRRFVSRECLDGLK
jgi:hypothetical protein